MIVYRMKPYLAIQLRDLAKAKNKHLLIANHCKLLPGKLCLPLVHKSKRRRNFSLVYAKKARFFKLWYSQRFYKS